MGYKNLACMWPNGNEFVHTDTANRICFLPNMTFPVTSFLFDTLKVLINLTQGVCFLSGFLRQLHSCEFKGSFEAASKNGFILIEGNVSGIQKRSALQVHRIDSSGQSLLFRVLEPLKHLQDPIKYLQEQEGSPSVHLCEQEPPRESEMQDKKPLTYFCVISKLFII